MAGRLAGAFLVGVLVGRRCAPDAPGQPTGNELARRPPTPRQPPPRLPNGVDVLQARMKLGLRRLLANGEFSWPDIPGPEEFLEGPFDPDRTCPLDGRRGLSALVATDPPTAAELRPWADALPDADAMDDLVAELEELLPRYAAEAYVVECSELPCILGVPLDHDALEEGPPSLVIARALGRLGFEPMRRSPSPTIDEPTDWGRYSRVAPDEALLFVAPVSSGASPPPVPDALAQRLDARAITLQLERTAEATGPDGPCAAYSQVLSEEMWDSAP